MKENGNGDQGRTFSKKTGIYIMNSNGSNNKRVAKTGQFPSFNKEGTRILFQTGGQFFGKLTKELKSVDLNGNDEKT